jgi:hypothetical protein
MSRFEEQDRLADKFLKKKGVVCMHKVARSGVSISLAKKTIETGKKVVIFEPVKRILRHTKSEIFEITNAKPKIACILPNVDLCAKLDPSLKLKFQFRENCGGCEYEGNPKSCMFQDLLLNDLDLYGLTYAKVMALLLSQSRDAEILLQKLWSCDVFILDEFTTAIIRDVPILPVKETDENDHVTRLSEQIEETKEHATRLQVPENESFVKEVFWSIAEQFLIQCENVSKSGEYLNKSTHGYTEEGILQTFGAGWRYITELTRMRIDTRVLQDVFLVALMSKLAS